MKSLILTAAEIATLVMLNAAIQDILNDTHLGRIESLAGRFGRYSV